MATNGVCTLPFHCRSEEASKCKTLLFAGSVSKKEQAKPALFWGKGNATPGQG
jgi:hypothetical protein